MTKFNRANNYHPALKACTTAGIELVPRDPDRVALTVFNHDATNTLNVYFGGTGQETMFLPIPPGTGLDIKPAPSNQVIGAGDGGTVSVTVWSA